MINHASAKRLRLSSIDRKMLKILLYPDGRISSKSIATKLELSTSTVQRHRRRLEEEVLIQIHVLDLSRFGWHRVDFLIATESGKTGLIATNLLKRDEVTYVGKCIGEHTIDLRVETILKDNAEILRMMELLKAMPGIKDVIWTEIVEVVGRKSSIPDKIIDKL